MGKTGEKNGEDSYSFLYILIKRSTIFLTLFLAAMLLLYFSGNFQSFQDSSLRITLFCSSLAALMLFTFSSIGILTSLIVAIVLKKPGHLIGTLTYILLDLASATVFVTLRGLTILTSGIQGIAG
ncbi:MAG: hypothetical protein K6G18_10925 [Treponema sp.]|nr:hypothetical protein [Treponema sp.]MCR5622349.1 hypothetical protein [Treponema sp.]